MTIVRGNWCPSTSNSSVAAKGRGLQGGNDEVARRHVLHNRPERPGQYSLWLYLLGDDAFVTVTKIIVV